MLLINGKVKYHIQPFNVTKETTNYNKKICNLIWTYYLNTIYRICDKQEALFKKQIFITVAYEVRYKFSTECNPWVPVWS